MENYARKPKDVECFTYDGGTDVIMRQNIHQVKQPAGSGPDGSEGSQQLTWECEEWQFRYPGTITPEEIKADWSRFWGFTPAKPDEGKAENEYVTYGDLRKAITEGVNSL